MNGGIGFFLFLAAIVVGYLFPAIVAALRHHHQANAICMLNIFLGWTLLGWVAALVWCATAIAPPDKG